MKRNNNIKIKAYKIDKIAKFLNISPITAWVVIFTVLPLVILFVYSFWQTKDFNIVRVFTLKNYISVFTDKLFGVLLLKTLGIALGVSLTCLIIGYFVAYFIANNCGKAKNFLYILVIIPLFTSYIIRIFAWKALLGKEGVINNILMYLKIIEEPVSFLLYSSFSVFLAMVGILLPYMILPIFSTIEKIPKSLYEAADDLGASKPFTFIKVIFPMSLPGVLAGVFLVFVFAMGDYITPKLIGGTNGLLLGLYIYSKFGFSFQWAVGSAMSFILLIITLIILNIVNRGGASEEL